MVSKKISNGYEKFFPLYDNDWSLDGEPFHVTNIVKWQENMYEPKKTTSWIEHWEKATIYKYDVVLIKTKTSEDRFIINTTYVISLRGILKNKKIIAAQINYKPVKDSGISENFQRVYLEPKFSESLSRKDACNFFSEFLGICCKEVQERYKLVNDKVMAPYKKAIHVNMVAMRRFGFRIKDTDSKETEADFT